MHLNEVGIDVFITSSRANEMFDPTTGLGGTRVKALERLVRTPCIKTTYNGENIVDNDKYQNCGNRP